MDITIYLMRETATLENAVSIDDTDDVWQRVPVRGNEVGGFETICFVKKTKPKKASWAPLLEQVFDFGDLVPTTQSSGCVVILSVGDRVFAVTFGGGRHTLRSELVEYDFGFRVALNVVNPLQLRDVVSRAVNVRSRERRTYFHTGGVVGEFGLDLNSEWLRSIAGTTVNSADYSSVAGADGIRIKGYKGAFNQLARLCEELLLAYGKGVPEAFWFADNVRPIAQHDPLHESLEEQLLSELKHSPHDAVEINLRASWMEQWQSARLFSGQRRQVLDDLLSDCVWSAVDELMRQDAGITLQSIKLEITGDAGSILAATPLLHLVHAELVHEGAMYVRIERRWFRISKDYVQQVEQRVKELTNLTSELDLPEWNKNSHSGEKDYNAKVAQSKNWLLQDQKFFCPAGTNGAGLEPCDLMTRDARWIHVKGLHPKDGGGSAKLSHLFGQVVAAADLYSYHDDFRKEMNSRFGTKWEGLSLDDLRSTFVAAIGGRTSADPFGKMLIAKINVLEVARRVQALNFDFAIATFDVEPADKKQSGKEDE